MAVTEVGSVVFGEGWGEGMLALAVVDTCMGAVEIEFHENPQRRSCNPDYCFVLSPAEARQLAAVMTRAADQADGFYDDAA
jgi:hypothetical protein